MLTMIFVGAGMVDASVGWLLAQPAVKSLVIGATTPEQIVANCKQFATAKSLSPSVVAELSAATGELKGVFGGECDLWQPEGESRFY
jgi:aryl-alcohol dehydrogenase-like predicted oxidoreductase